MAIRLQNFKLKEQDTRLVLFGSTVFKIKYRTSCDLRETMGVQSKAMIQNDLKRVTAAVLSQALTRNTLPHIRTDSIAVYTGSCPWTECDNLYFAYQDQPLSAHPHVILMLVSLIPLPTQQKCVHSKLGKHKRRETEKDAILSYPVAVDENLDLDICDGGMVCKRLRTGSGAEADVHLPDSGAACLPTGSVEGGRVLPRREQVMAAAEQSKKRLHALSQPFWEGNVAKQDNSLTKGRSLFQYVKWLLGWM